MPTLIGVGLKEQRVDDEELEELLHEADKRLDYLVLADFEEVIDCKSAFQIARWTKAL